MKLIFEGSTAEFTKLAGNVEKIFDETINTEALSKDFDKKFNLIRDLALTLDEKPEQIAPLTIEGRVVRKSYELEIPVIFLQRQSFTTPLAVDFSGNSFFGKIKIDDVLKLKIDIIPEGGSRYCTVRLNDCPDAVQIL